MPSNFFAFAKIKKSHFFPNSTHRDTCYSHAANIKGLNLLPGVMPASQVGQLSYTYTPVVPMLKV